MDAPLTLLVDNGSLAPSATLQLRRVAIRLAQAIGAPVDPVSLLHSHSIPVSQLDGRPGEILEPALEARLGRGQTRFVIVPLFFGPSFAVTHQLADRMACLTARHPSLCVRVAAPLFSTDDDRLARILSDRIHAVAPNPSRIALVDHGSPVKEVTAVRHALAIQLQSLLGGKALVAASSMERRPETEYDFNEPLLESLLDRTGWDMGEVVVAAQFLLPGRHAGPGGDLAQICRRAERLHPGLRTHLTDPMADHPLLISILADRWQSVAQADW